MKKQTLIISVIILALLVGVVFALFRNKKIALSVIAPSLSINSATTSLDSEEGDEKEVEEGVTLYFTKVGCTSLPYISATSGIGEERASTTEISANDGYNYAVIDGSRSVRTVVSNFDGSCKNITPKQLDSFEALDVGPTQPALN